MEIGTAFSIPVHMDTAHLLPSRLQRQYLGLRMSPPQGTAFPLTHRQPFYLGHNPSDGEGLSLSTCCLPQIFDPLLNLPENIAQLPRPSQERHHPLRHKISSKWLSVNFLVEVSPHCQTWLSVCALEHSCVCVCVCR